MIFGAIRKHLGEVFHNLAAQKGIVIEEGHLMNDHVHMCLSIPPKYSVSNVVGFIKGKSAIEIVNTLIREGFISSLQHAADMGIELQKAELSLKYGFKYVQDKDLDID